jgi:hypothetical protein
MRPLGEDYEAHARYFASRPRLRLRKLRALCQRPAASVLGWSDVSL